MKNGETEIERWVEQLCQEGCDRVYEHIDALQAGARELPGIGPLTLSERRSVLNELVSIMAVYENGWRR